MTHEFIPSYELGVVEITDAPNDRGSGKAEHLLHYMDVARRPIPPREWAVYGRIPASNVTLLSGEGSAGKSLILLQLSVAHVLGHDWIGTVPEPGPVMYLSCEDDDDELCRRLEAIAKNYGASRDDLKESLHIMSFAGKDAALAVPDRNGRMSPTQLLQQLRGDALRIRPKLIAIDTVADVFAGNENDRAQTRQFVTLLRSLAIKTKAAVILVSHPSLTGIASGSGLSGSTAWHNSVRARMYLKTLDETDDDMDSGLRVLEVKKNNYGPTSERIVLRWRDGLYLPEPRTGSVEKLATDKKIDDLFLTLLKHLNEQGRNVTDKRSSSYAPTVFAEQAEAKTSKTSKRAFAEAMTRLFDAKRIRVATFGPPSHLRSKIEEVGS